MVRLKSRWHRKDAPRRAEEVGSAVAFSAWKVALEGVRRLLGAGYELESDPRRFAILGEFAAFLLQMADRYAYGRLEDEQRRRMIVAAGRRMAEVMEENQRERLGPGDYRAAFIDHLNRRLQEYAELSFVGEEPGFSSIRYLGEVVCEHAGDWDRRWLKEQVMEVEAPEAVRAFRRALANLLAVQVC
ncbi:hypothetical protein [Inmirania thermothiophila]|uniref:Uncharacterized protein n=1 Tax=Inmirania thermothiophila TaxID=1750597 RepID=A0A3N1Y0X3_9GAMM|nr:hypothetical protein [Inmirania thermothiophila]ROR32181.1 hypothetical protein EDC57_1372 [Inmirania thermothiophila]